MGKKDTDSVSAWRLLTAKRYSAVDAPKAAPNLSPKSSQAYLKMVKELLVSGIKAYQCLSRALLFRNCRFYPSCSQYAIEAIERFGILKGVLKAIARILRCSPATDGGYDPVR